MNDLKPFVKCLSIALFHSLTGVIRMEYPMLNGLGPRKAMKEKYIDPADVPHQNASKKL